MNLITLIKCLSKSTQKMGLDNIFWHTFLKEGQRNNLFNTDWQFNIYGKRWERDWFCIRCDIRSKFIPSFIQGINLTQTGFWFQKRLLIWNWSTKNDKQHWYDSDWKISFRKKKKQKKKRSHKRWSTVTKLVGNGIMSSTDENAVWRASIVNMLLLLQRVEWIHTVRIKFNIEIT